MKDDLHTSSMLPATTPMQVELPPPLVALEYQPPQPGGGRRRGDMGWGFLISFFVAFGTGWLIFGSLMMAGKRDDHAGPVALGAASIVLGAGVAASLVWSRRQR